MLKNDPEQLFVTMNVVILTKTFPYEHIVFTFHDLLNFWMWPIFLSTFIDGPKDTSPEDTLEKTYVPSLKTLEEEVMEKLGIQENRHHRRSYWY